MAIRGGEEFLEISAGAAYPQAILSSSFALIRVCVNVLRL